MQKFRGSKIPPVQGEQKIIPYPTLKKTYATPLVHCTIQYTFKKEKKNQEITFDLQLEYDNPGGFLSLHFHLSFLFLLDLLTLYIFFVFLLDLLYIFFFFLDLLYIFFLFLKIYCIYFSLFLDLLYIFSFFFLIYCVYFWGLWNSSMEILVILGGIRILKCPNSSCLNY